MLPQYSRYSQILKPPCDIADASKIIADAEWFKSVDIEPVYASTGPPMLGFRPDGARYIMRLFPDENQWSDSVIVVQLSGEAGQSPNALRAFFRGGEGPEDKRQLVDFAISYPKMRTTSGFTDRIEHFGANGMTVLVHED